MELAFDSLELRDLCEKKLHAEKQLGVEIAAVLRDHLADLASAPTLADLPDAPKSSNGGTFKIIGTLKLQITFSPNHSNASQRRERKRIRRIKILSVDIV